MIVELGVEDAGEVLTLQRAAYVSEAMAYDQFLPPLHETLDEVREVLRRTDVTVLGIRDNGRLIGMVRLLPGGEIGRLAVAPDRQGEGLGSLLLREVIARSPGEALWLFTGEHSEGNLRLYRRLGFEETHRASAGDHDLVYLRRPAA